MRTGFTMVELVLVIAIIGILAISVLPSFIDFSGDAEKKAIDSIAVAIDTGIKMYAQNEMVHGRDLTYPPLLDDAGSNVNCSTNPCFGNILQNPITDDSWSKMEATRYFYRSRSGTKDRIYMYSPLSGRFWCYGGMGCF